VTTWIWDASALHHAAKADRLDVLLDIAKAVPNAPARCLTTALVVEELAGHGLWEVCAPHLDVVDLESLDEIQALTRWLAVVSNGPRSRGEATVFAWAEVNDGSIIIDDGDARRAAERHGQVVHGTLWILVQAIQADTLSPASADALVNEFRATGARLPGFPAGGIVSWARQSGLLKP
jgi:predicted nucleic acid-binding protein